MVKQTVDDDVDDTEFGQGVSSETGEYVSPILRDALAGKQVAFPAPQDEQG